jgi:hypothetical protein
MDFGAWDIRRAAVSGKTDRLARKINKHMDAVHRKVYELLGQGKNITRWVFIGNMKDLSASEQLCLRCENFNNFTKFRKVTPGFLFISKISIINYDKV